MVNIRDDLAREATLHSPDPVDWTVSDAAVPYPEAVAAMEAHVAAMIAGEAGERVWLLEHPPTYTAGTSARDEDLIEPDRFPVFRTGRGGQFTYHGPGQRVAYAMLDLEKRGKDVRRYVAGLERWIISSLEALNVRGERRDDRIGVWVRRPDKGSGVEDKIAALGIRVRRWIAFHGIAVNVDPELSHFTGIVPCGVSAHSVTSLADLGQIVTMAEFDSVLKAQFEVIFGPVRR